VTCHIVESWPHALCGFDFNESRGLHTYVEALGRRLEMVDCRACLREMARDRDAALAKAEGETLSWDGLTVCVFCGSRPGRDPRYLEDARELGTGLAQRGIRIVYGGASVGLMGAMADAALGAGGEVVSVVPECLYGPEARHAGVSRVVETPDLHERKRTMFGMADAFVAMPGGVGTLDEILEVMAWAQLRTGGVDGKPLFLLDTLGYFEPFVRMVMHSQDSGFSPSSVAPAGRIVPDVPLLLDALGSLKP